MSGSKPLFIFACPVAEMVARVLPWKELFAVIISNLVCPGISLKYFRASFMAASLASAPELQKNTLSAKEFSTSSFASFICG
jgi:hypothetical protein